MDTICFCGKDTLLIKMIETNNNPIPTMDINWNSIIDDALLYLFVAYILYLLASLVREFGTDIIYNKMRKTKSEDSNNT